MTAPTVSIVIPAYNAAACIQEALASVFEQTYTDFEVVVVDDGSTDATVEEVQRWGDRVTLIRQDNRGPGAARNAGIARSRGRLIAFQDADDLWLPDKLQLQVDYFARYPETGLLHTATCPPGTSWAGLPPRSTLGMSPPQEQFGPVFQTDVDVNTLTVMTCRGVLDTVGGFDERREIHVEDWDLWLRIAARYPVGYLPHATAIRRPGGVMSTNLEATFRGQAAVIRKIEALVSAGEAPPGCTEEALRKRWHRYYWELGYARLRAGDRVAARRAFARAVAISPLHRLSHLHLAGSFLSPRVLDAARQWRLNRMAQPVPRRIATRAPALAPARSLVHDTVYRRARRMTAGIIHSVDDSLWRLRRGERQVILFEAASPMSFGIFKPVYDRLKADPRLEFRFTATGSAWSPDALFAKVGITEHVLRPSRAAWLKADACINTDFWDSTWLHRRTRRIHLFHGVAGKYGLDAPVELAPTVASFDRLLFPNEDRLARYMEAGLVARDGPVACLVGYPKLDCLVDGSIDTQQLTRQLGLERDRPVVLYAPTWSPHSSLHAHGEELIAQLVASGYAVLVKLHDRSYDVSERGSAGIDWRERMHQYRNHRFIRVLDTPDATPFLALADALVTDHSSIGFEFAVVNRPIVVMDCPELLAQAKVSRSKVADLRSAAEVVASPSDAGPAIARQLANPSLHRDERLQLARRFFYRPGTATTRAVAAIYETLGLEAPNAESVPSTRGASAQSGSPGVALVASDDKQCA